MAQRQSDTFGRLVKGAINAIANFEGKNAVTVEEEIGDLIGMAPTAIHRFKSGAVPSNPEIVAILAEAGVTRAYLSRAWLHRFLQAARYYDSAALVERLLPAEPQHQPIPHLLDNLPAPTYSQFVMRAEPYAAVLEGLRQRVAVVALVSLGGMGKSSLAREIAATCLRSPGGNHGEGISFDAVVWISDKNQPSATTLTTVLDEIARTLNYPGLTQLNPAQKEREINQLLKRQRVLLVVDNFETVTDATLLHWLMRLPEPSKALLTTRESLPEFRQGAWLIELHGMADTEAREFINERVRQIGLKPAPSDPTRQLLIATTGGNPRAIELLLGFARNTGQPLTHMAAQFEAASGDLLNNLFDASWAVLSEAAQQALLTLMLFPSSVEDQVFAEIAGFDMPAFLAAVQQLTELALLEIEHGQREDASPRRTLHPLTRRFVGTKLGVHAPFVATARERWLAWATGYAGSFGYAVGDIARLERVDPEADTLFAALVWAYEHGRDAEVVHIAKGIEFYYYVRALWGKKLAIHAMYIESARRLGDNAEQVNALAMHIQLLCRQRNHAAAEVFLPALRTLTTAQAPTGEQFFHVNHALSLYYLASGQYKMAYHLWQEILDQAKAQVLPDHMVIGTLYWQATCLRQQGDRKEARRLYQAALVQAQQHGYARTVARSEVELAALDLEQGDIESAEQRLRVASAATEGSDWEQRARIQQVKAHLYAHQCNMQAEQAALLEARDLFTRMGLLAEAAHSP
ncbi:MAG: hypothetical protein H7Z42_12360 [Roseiflexaceae bacterium]|nr:hypothetical protein [Roseiflexaceae bacterium]